MPSPKRPAKTQSIRDRNELMQGPAPKCLAVLKRYTKAQLCTYPDGYYGSRVAERLAKTFGLPRDQVLMCYGAEQFLGMVFDTLRAGDCVLTQQYHYRYYPIPLKAKGIPLHTFAMHEKGHDYAFDTDDCISKLKALRPRLLLLTSPNNPTGTTLPLADFTRILSAAGKDTLVILDEAYLGFDPDYKPSAWLKLLGGHPNLILLRTFSKYYGLAGARLGYALCGKGVVAALKYVPPFLGMSTLVEEVALAALDSPAYYKATAAEVVRERARIIAALKKSKVIHPYHSKANMVLIRVPAALDAMIGLALPGIAVLTLRKDRPGFWRISVGTRPVNDAMLRLLARLEKGL